MNLAGKPTCIEADICLAHLGKLRRVYRRTRAGVTPRGAESFLQVIPLLTRRLKALNSGSGSVIGPAARYEWKAMQISIVYSTAVAFFEGI